jgi:hypothetical protein
VKQQPMIGFEAAQHTKRQHIVHIVAHVGIKNN